jgi:hypothetical protein
MGIKKFITTVTESLGLEVDETTKKKKALKALIKKLASKKSELKKALKKKVEKNQKKELDEEYEIVCIQLKKGTKLLQKLNQEK